MIEFPVRRYCSRDEGWLGSVSRQKIKERLQITPFNLWRHFSPAIWREGYWRHKNIQYLDTNPISGDVYVRSNMNHHNIYWLIYRQYHSPCHLLLLLLRAASWTTYDDVDGRKPAGDDHGLHNACYAGGWWWWILDMYDDLWRPTQILSWGGRNIYTSSAVGATILSLSAWKHKVKVSRENLKRDKRQLMEIRKRQKDECGLSS